MTSFKKSLISLAAVMAISSVATAATSNYVPLATDTRDYTWKMFGVDGLFGSGSSTAFTTGGGWGNLEDPTADENSVSGIQDAGAGGDLVQLKALSGTANDLTGGVIINVNNTDTIWSETEPTRTMFIAAEGTAANVMVTYKASLEDLEIEIQSNGTTDTTLVVDLKAEYTYDNPAIPGTKSGAVGASTLDTIAEATDFDFTDNPKDSTSYETALHQTAATANESVRMYSYSSADSTWLIYDSDNTADANDFSSLKEGKGYWGKMNMDGGVTTVNGLATPAGVIIGDGGLDSTDYIGELEPGWNLLSFDSRKPEIRAAATGLLVTDLIASGAGDILIYDSTDTNFITVTLGGVSTQDDAKIINRAVEQAQDRGDFSDTFDLRVYPVSVSQLAFISNKRFTLAEGDATDNLSTAVTLAGSLPWDKATNAVATGPVNIGVVPGAALAAPMRSMYGEYSVIVQPLLGADTASELDFDGPATAGVRSAAVQINDNATLAYFSADDATTIAAGTAAFITSVSIPLVAESTANGGAGIGTGINLDVQFDGVTDDDWVLLASDRKFYVRDHTFTRSFTQTTFGGQNLALIGNITPGNVASGGDGATTAANFLGAAANGVYGYNDGVVGNHDFTLVTAEAGDSGFNLFDNDGTEIIDDQLTLTTDVVKGAIKGVASVSDFAKLEVTPYNFTFEVDAASMTAIDGAGDTVIGTINAVAQANILGGIDLQNNTSAANRGGICDSIVADIQAYAVAQGLDVAVSHDYDATLFVSGTDADMPVTFSVEGYGINAVSYDFNNGAPDVTVTTQITPTADAGKITTSADLVADLKYNAVYTPDYAVDGPLYALKEQGYTALAMISGNTDMASGTVSWSSIDLTRDPVEMFDNQDFNLFTIDPRAGYWTYLETNVVNGNDTNMLDATNLGTNNHSYIHHFNADGTTENHVSANINVLVTGITEDTLETSTVYASVGGSKIQLTSESPFTGEFSGDLTSYEVSNMRATGAGDVSVILADGTQWKRTVTGVKTIDLTKPTVPTVDPTGAQGLTVTASTADTAAMYIFSGNIPESVLANDATTQAHANFVARMEVGSGAGLSFCSNPTITFGTTINLQIVALDGLGYFGQGNASDITTFDFAPATKSSIVLEHIGDGSLASELGTPFDSNCSAGVVETADSGMSIKSLTAGVTVKLAYEKGPTTFTTDIPYTVYVDDGSGNISEIKFVGAYAGQAAYIQYDVGGVKTMYGINIPADDTLHSNSTIAYDLSQGNPAPAGPAPFNALVVTGQSF